MNNKHYLGSRVSGFDLYDEIGPITGVALIVQGSGEEKEFLADGSDTSGYVLEIPYPYSHQGQLVADTIFEKVRGKTYKGFRATGARFDPLAELGDGITANGTYSMMAYRRANFGPNHTSEVSAPGENAVQHEYSAGSGISKDVRRLKAESYSLISKTAESIKTEVVGYLEVDENGDPIPVSSSIETALKGITLSVTDEDGSTTLTLSGGGATLTSETFELHVKAANIHGTLTADKIDATDLKVNAANITGALTIGQLPEGVATTDDVRQQLGEMVDEAGWLDYGGVVSIIEGTVTADYINACEVKARYLFGAEVGLIAPTYDYITGKLVGSTTIGALGLTPTSDGVGLSLSTYYLSGGIKIEANGGNVWIDSVSGASLMLGDGMAKDNIPRFQVQGYLTLGYQNCGTALPITDLVEGRVFFKYA